MFLDCFKKLFLDYFSDGSLLRYSSKSNCYYFFCEHFPRRHVAKRLLFLDSGTVKSSVYCQRCKINKECLNHIEKIKEKKIEQID